MPGKFTAELYFEVDNAPIFEMTLHKILHEYRYEKEFFKLNIHIVIQAIHHLIEEPNLIKFIFYGKSRSLATTKEQIAEQGKQSDLEKERLEELSRQFKEKYLNKTIEELVFDFNQLLAKPSYSSLKEAKEIEKLINMMRKQVREESRQKYLESDEYKRMQKIN